MKNLMLTQLLITLITFLLPITLATNTALAQTQITPTTAPQTSTQTQKTKPNDPTNNAQAPEQTPREIYNTGITFLNQSDYPNAIKTFLKARDHAASDSELRYNAAYNLAFTYAKQAQAKGNPNELQPEQLKEAIQDLKNSAAWFRDALKQKKHETDTRYNLELVLKQSQALTDILNKKFNQLEKQLEELITEQRKIREISRTLSFRLQVENANNNPITFQNDFQSAASQQRTILTQANLVAELIADELNLYENIDEKDPQKQQHQLRAFQLSQLSPIFQQARQNMLNARTFLRDLDIQNAMMKIATALNLLKQAREELQMPLERLQAIYHDQFETLESTINAKKFDNNEIKEPNTQKPLPKPTWLANEFLKNKQEDLHQRTSKLQQFIDIAATSPIPTEHDGKPLDEKQRQTAIQQQQKFKEIKPLIDDAAQNMTQAIDNLSNNTDPLKSQNIASAKLQEALEAFASLKQLIEIIYQTQSPVTLQLTEKMPNNTELPPIQNQLEILLQLTQTNAKRLEKLENLIAEESQKSDPQQQLSKEQIQQRQKLFEEAEKLRANALNAVQQLKDQLPQLHTESINQPDINNIHELAKLYPNLITLAQNAQKDIENLRMLFFTIVEHLKELARQQEKTIDQTTDLASLQKTPDISIDASEPTSRQKQHEHIASQLTQALEQMAKQSAEAQNAPQQQQQQQQQNYNQAASEMQLASSSMRLALSNLDPQTQNFTMALEEQNKSLQHVINAIHALEPPKEQQQQQQDQQNQQQQQQNLSKEQVNKKLQQIKELEESKRATKKHNAQQAVEKDW